MTNPMCGPDLSRLTSHGHAIYIYLLGRGYITKAGAFEFVSAMYVDEQRQYCRDHGLVVES